MKISILGCGWLGLPVAQVLVKKKIQVTGSTTSKSKLELLKKNTIEAHIISLEENKINGHFKSFLEDSTTLIINIPPKLRGENKENFVAKIKNTIPFIEQSIVENVLFVSSTSVYADTENIFTITEESVATPDTESGKQLLEVEKLLLNNVNFKTTIVRFGGLIGSDRHPVHFLSGKTNLDNPDGPINLIHQDDCIQIILKIIENHAWNKIYNAVAPFHPTRKEYYTQKALELELEIPLFTNSKSSVGKIISSEKLINELQYTFQHKI